MGNQNSGPAGESHDCENIKKETLMEAFEAGFRTGRTGRYFGEIAEISRSAAASKFERYYEHQYEE